MKKLIITAVIASSFSGLTFAEKIYMGVFKTSTEYGAWVTLRDAPCNKVDGNAVVMSGKNKHNGCWKLEDKQVRIDWLDSSTPNFYEKDGFKLVGDTDLDSTKSAQQTQAQPSNEPTRTTLNCQAPAWVGDVLLERDATGALKRISISGNDVAFTEKDSSIAFSFNSLNISLSNVTGMFSYEPTMVSQLVFKSNNRGSGRCVVVDGQKKF